MVTKGEALYLFVSAVFVAVSLGGLYYLWSINNYLGKIERSLDNIVIHAKPHDKVEEFKHTNK